MLYRLREGGREGEREGGRRERGREGGDSEFNQRTESTMVMHVHKPLAIYKQLHVHENRKQVMVQGLNLQAVRIIQGVVTPIRTVVTAKTGVKKWSTIQGVFSPLVK